MTFLVFVIHTIGWVSPSEAVALYKILQRVAGQSLGFGRKQTVQELCNNDRERVRWGTWSFVYPIEFAKQEWADEKGTEDSRRE